MVRNEGSVNVRYLIAGARDEAWGITVNSLGRQDIAPDSLYPPRSHPQGYYFTLDKGRILDEYQLLYITRGKGSFVSDSSGEKMIESGMMFIVFPGEWHTYAPKKGSGWNEYWIGFRGESMDRRLAEGFFDKKNPLLNVGVDSKLIAMYNEAIDVAKEQLIGYQYVLGGIVERLLSLAWTLNAHYSVRNVGINIVIQQAKAIMIDAIFDNISAEEVAEKLNMGYSSFRKQFKKHTGLSPAQYIGELKILKAKELLRNTTTPISEISDQLRFSSVEYFFTAFKRGAKITPQRYRDQCQAERGI